ncbi:hypothetical protein, partial [Thomasclavelia cocleata]
IAAVKPAVHISHAFNVTARSQYSNHHYELLIIFDIALMTGIGYTVDPFAKPAKTMLNNFKNIRKHI